MVISDTVTLVQVARLSYSVTVSGYSCGYNPIKVAI